MTQYVGRIVRVLVIYFLVAILTRYADPQALKTRAEIVTERTEIDHGLEFGMLLDPEESAQHLGEIAESGTGMTEIKTVAMVGIAMTTGERRTGMTIDAVTSILGVNVMARVNLMTHGDGEMMANATKG